MKRQPEPADRLLDSPVFVLSSIRSGSTLLRVMLNAHSQIYAPYELHLRGLRARAASRFAQHAMGELGLDDEHLQFMLWDRLLHWEMTRHGKSVIVNKTPSDALIWRRIAACWPGARFVFLLRHPAAVADSWQRAQPDWTRERVAAYVLRYMAAVEEARQVHGGLTLRYEDLTTDPEREMRRACEFIDVAYEPAMLDYGAAESNKGTFRRGLGDWGENIESGQVRPVGQLPDAADIPDALVDVSRKWGYLVDGG